MNAKFIFYMHVNMVKLTFDFGQICGKYGKVDI